MVPAAAREPALGEPAPFRFPVQSARILSEQAAAGTIFASDSYGDYLIWALCPRYKPYIDTRLVLRTPQEFADYLDAVDHPDRFDGFQDRLGFDYVLLPTGYPDRYLDLIAHLYSSANWRVLFTDGTEVLFARQQSASEIGWNLRAPETTALVLQKLSSRFRDSPRLQFAGRRSHRAEVAGRGRERRSQFELDGDGVDPPGTREAGAFVSTPCAGLGSSRFGS
jgi:hypothetical protein